MELSVSQQAMSLILAAAAGLIIGLFYDLLRIIRVLLPKSKLLTFVFDILFWLIVLVFVFSFNMIFMSGTVRWYTLFGAICGTALYFLIFGSVIVTLGEKAADIIAKCLGAVITPIVKGLHSAVTHLRKAIPRPKKRPDRPERKRHVKRKRENRQDADDI